MSDFNCITYTKIIPVTEIGIHSPGTLSVEGSDVLSTDTVFINGVSTKEFIILSKTKLIVDIPSQEQANPIRTVTLAGPSGDVGILGFDLTSKLPMTDSKYVIQRFFRFLFTNPGSDVFNPAEGVGLVSKVGGTAFENMEVEIITCIKQAENYVLNTQQPELPDSKTLRMVNVSNVSYSINTLTASVSLSFELADGTLAYTDFKVAS